jgi:hypothetical protein
VPASDPSDFEVIVNLVNPLSLITNLEAALEDYLYHEVKLARQTIASQACLDSTAGLLLRIVASELPHFSESQNYFTLI